jgi:hypothetical protein
VDVLDPERRGVRRARGREPSSRRLPAEDVTVGIHCVTKWSKLDTR